MTILVFGFDQSIPSKRAAPALDELNQSRDNFPKERMAFRDEIVSNLSREEKMVRADALEGLIRDYLEMKRGEREDRALAEVLRRLGEIQIDLNEHLRAIQLFSQSLEISRNVGDKIGEADSLAGLGRVGLSLADYPKAIDYYEQALTIAREIGDRKGEAKASWNREIGHPDAEMHAERLQSILDKLKS